MNISFLQRFLQLAHSAADHGTRSRATSENKIRDPNLAEELRGPERLPVLIGELKIRNRSIGLNCSIAQIVHFTLPDKEKDGRDNERNSKRSEERRVGKECRSRWSPYP